MSQTGFPISAQCPYMYTSSIVCTREPHLRAGDHGVGVEAEVEHSLAVVDQRVQHLSGVHVPHSGGRGGERSNSC